MKESKQLPVENISEKLVDNITDSIWAQILSDTKSKISPDLLECTLIEVWKDWNKCGKVQSRYQYHYMYMYQKSRGGDN